jgi:hypothetical protein
MKSESEEEPENTRARKRLAGIVVGALVLVLCLTAFFIHEAPTREKFAWLEPSRLIYSREAGPLTRLRRRLESLPGIKSVVERYHQQKPRIFTDAGVWTVPPGALDSAVLGSPMATNTSGVRVWILPPTAVSNFNARLKKTPGAAPAITPKLWLLNNTQGRIQTGAWVNVGTNNLFAGFTMDVGGKAVFSSVKMSLGITMTKVVSGTGKGLLTLQTNLATGCEVVLPDNGAVVIDGGAARNDGGKGYWFVVSPSVRDMSGKPYGTK